MLCDVVRRCRRWAHAPVIHAASHFYHEKRVAWVSISMHACDAVPIVMGLCFRSSTIIVSLPCDQGSLSCRLVVLVFECHAHWCHLVVD